jgi:hypothetical protein
VGDDRGVAQQAVVSKTGGLLEAGAGPGLGDRSSLGQWHLRVVLIVDHEKRLAQSRGQGLYPEVVPPETDAALAPALHEVDHFGGEAEPRRENLNPGRRVHGRGDEHHPADGQAVPHS